VKHHLSSILPIAIFAVISIAVHANESGTIDDVRNSLITNRMPLFSTCVTDAEISAAIQKLSLARSSDVQQRSLDSLRRYANKSGECRQQVITTLTATMDKRNLDLAFDQQSFYLWHYGAKLLAEWKAVETLDFLIAHLDLDDGSPFPLDHHPALVAVIDFGELALPKLAETLRAKPDLDTRQYVVFCIASIGGASARQVLSDALKAESDRCVRTFVEASLKAFDNTARPNHVTSGDRARWYATFLCPGRFTIVQPKPTP